jgi:hypothetical protein
MAMPNDLDSLTEQTLQLAVVARALDERSQQATRTLEHAAQELAAAAAQLTGAGERIGRDASRVIAHEASAQARRAAAEAFADARAALDTHAGRVRELDATLQASRIATATMQRRWLVLAPAAAIAGCVLAVIGATAWVAKARSDVERHRVDAATLQAVQAADLVHCGDALCARTERGAAPNGYRRVAPRQAH